MKKAIRTDPFIFRWKVSEAGYQWANGISDGKPHLVTRFEPGKGIRLIEPPNGTFAEFARLEPTENGIREFAEKFGDLFDTYSEPDHVAHDGTVSGGASMKRWRSAIGDMRVLFDLWKSIQNRRFAELKKVISWQKTGRSFSSVSYRIETPTRKRDQMLGHSKFSRNAFSRFSKGDVLLPARYALQEEINLRLAEHPTVPRLAWTPDTRETSGGYYQRIVFIPPNLLAAMWLQFAQAVTGEFGLQQCICGKFFQVGPGGRRADATTCSDACRQRKRRRTNSSESG